MKQTQWIIEKSEAEAEHGTVAAMHPLAAEAGLEMLKAGATPWMRPPNARSHPSDGRGL